MKIGFHSLNPMKPKIVFLVAVSSVLVALAWIAMTKGSPASPADSAATETKARERNSAARATKSPTRTGSPTRSARTTPSSPEEDPTLIGPIDEGMAPPEAPIVAAEALLADYHSEAFRIVPAWLPRPLQAERAIPEDATLRSDGLSEGVVRYNFSGDTTAPLASFQEQLIQSGFTANETKTTFTAADPPRTCTLTISGSQIVATYQMHGGHNHAPGEGCSCGH